MKNLLFLIISIHSLNCVAQSPQYSVISPNKKIKFDLEVLDSGVFYKVYFKGVPKINRSSLAFNFGDNDQFGTNEKIANYKIANKIEKYSLVVGKAKNVSEPYQEGYFSFNSKVDLVVRAFNNGVAFRFIFKKNTSKNDFLILEEKSTFNIAQNSKVHYLPFANYLSSHEGLYKMANYYQIDSTSLIDLPLVFESPTSVMAITEASLLNYAGMYLAKSKTGGLVSKLSPLPNQSGIKVKNTARSPWRVIMLAENIGTLIESNLITNLNENPKNKDWTWLKPGSSTFTWWNGDYLENVDFKVGMNFETHKHYIDFCAKNNINFHSVVSFGSHAWYVGETEGFYPGSDSADVTKPVSSLDMERLAAYSRQKGVGLRVWVNWKSLSRNLEKAFAQYEKWNIKGLMVDFMDRDDQEMVNFVEKVLDTAAKYHLHIQFHGTYKPTGLSRTYPNELTKEAVLNLEGLKWGNACDPEHNLTVAFTRMLAGPMDFHSVGFRATTRAAFPKDNYIAPKVLGTRSHHLAMPIVYESYLQLLCDYPQAYENQVGFDFITHLPAIWDETKVLQSKIGDYLTIARKKDNIWYIGTMNDWTNRELDLKLDFLPKGEFTAEIYADAPDSDVFPNHAEKSKITVTNKSIIKINLASGGGHAVKVFKK